MRRIASLVVLSLLAVPAVHSQAPGLRGFTPASAEAERTLEATFREIPKAANMREYMLATASEPHHAGSPGSRKVAEYILAKFKSFGLDAAIEEQEALMPVPTERVVELVEPERFTAALKEPAVPEDPDTADEGGLPTFNAYAADGDVTADLVYVNYGIPEDYEELAKRGIDVKGKIVLARYGRSWRGIKPKVAYEHGAVGCLIYSDPREDGYYAGDAFPAGPFRPEQGAQRGSVMDMPVYPGDPLTPGWGSEAGGKKLTREEAVTLLKIPVLPISYGDALPLLRNLKGPVAPEAWRGALPVTYHIGPGPAKVHIKLAFDWQSRPLYNVIARIPGSVSPDQWIVHGNHHDAWVNGAADPTSGNVALMETARGLGELLKTGWKPKRTIVFASWDGEEWGLLGSTEWAEKHKDALASGGVIYVNSDGTGKGWLGMSGSHSLQAFMNEVARDVPDPRGSGKSVLEAKRAHDLEQTRTADARVKLEKGDLAIGALGSGSDYTVFLDHLGIASLNLGFGGDGGDGGVYHSTYDTYYWYTHFSDGADFAHSVGLSQVVGTLLLRFANADVLPFEFGGTAKTLRGYTDEIARLSADTRQPLDLEPLTKALDRLDKAAAKYDTALGRLDRVTTTPDAARFANLNARLYGTERAFLYDEGLPRRAWFKHLAYAPGLYTGYGVKTLPGIREALEQKSVDEAKRFVPIVAASVDRLRGEVEQATRELEDATKR